MAITLPHTFVAGAARLGSQVNANCEAVRTWMNGRIVTADIVDRTAASDHIVRPEHYGPPVDGSQSTFADAYGQSVSLDKYYRAVFQEKVIGSDAIFCPELSKTITLEREAWVNLTARWYWWGYFHSVAGPAAPLGLTVGWSRLFINGSMRPAATRRISLWDTPSTEEAEPSFKECACVHAELLAAGTYTFEIGVRTVPDGVGDCYTLISDVALAGGNELWFVYIEARSFVLEVDYTMA